MELAVNYTAKKSYCRRAVELTRKGVVLSLWQGVSQQLQAAGDRAPLLLFHSGQPRHQQRAPAEAAGRCGGQKCPQPGEDPGRG